MSISTTAAAISGRPISANVTAAGRIAQPDVRLLSLVDLLAEAYVAKMVAANDDRAPTRE
jgi:hypothetical protein